mmetsp:Transcript_56476/g.175209  ORF Transcript_56476/g.175209 Transcript_56476/m.175209 type:complete len:218 (+) Transcript_56476:618-1271(+)
MLHSRLELLGGAERPPVPLGADCEAYPMFCQAPFNCGQVPVTKEEKRGWHKRIATEDGHANVRSFCWDLKWADSLVKECMVNHDLLKSAQLVYRRQFQSGAMELDGSYCFIEGHCTNPYINANSTYDDAERDCNRKYGHSAWANFGRLDAFGGSIKGVLANKMSHSDGFQDMNISHNFAKIACAMGNYHCDVVYCKETYCKDPYFIRRYKHLSGREV